REERRTLLDRPRLLHRLDVERGQLADVAVGSGHLGIAPLTRRAARTFLELDLPPQHLHAALAQRNDELAGSGVVTHGLPVVAALRAGTRFYPLADLLLEDVAPVSQF